MPEVIEFGYRLPDAANRLERIMAQDAMLILVDIRHNANGKNNPKWSGEVLQAKFGKRYLHIPELGNINYYNGGPITIKAPHVGIPRLANGLRRGYKLVILCACEDYHKCHRCKVIKILLAYYKEEQIQIIRQPIIEDGMIAAISISQPWLELILAGIKTIENRQSGTLHRGKILLQAPQKFEAYAFERGGQLCAGWENYGEDVWAALPKHRSEYKTGAILGWGELVDVVTESNDRWFRGPYGLVLRNVVRFERPIPARGDTGIFALPESILEGIRA